MWLFRTDPARKQREQLLHAAGITRGDRVDWRTLMQLEPKDWEITRWYHSEAAYVEERQRLATLGWQVEEEDRGAYVTSLRTVRRPRYVASVTYKYVLAPPAGAETKQEFWQ
jgi:hypothetical protein